MDLKTPLFNSFFSSPIFLASGILGSTISSLRRVYNKGASLVVTKSMGKESSEGYPNPVICGNEHYLINSIGLASEGIENFCKEAEDENINFPFVGSIFAQNANNFSYLAKKMEDINAKAVELNISCPHARKDLGISVACDLDLVYDIVKKTSESIEIPTSVKIPPFTNINYLHKLVGKIEKAGANAIVATNTIPAIDINIYSKSPTLSNSFGGMSGPALKPVALRAVYEIKKFHNIDVVGVGGISCGGDVLEYLMAGASAVQIGSSVYYRDIDIFSKIKHELSNLLDKLGYSSSKEVIGIAQKD